MSFADISSHNPIKRLLTPQSTVFSWELLVLQLLFLALVAVSMDKPTGSLSGQVALEEKGFDLATYNLRDHHVYAIVNGPRSGQSIERGSWVKADGTFEIGQLPVGEYLLRVRAPGFATETVESLFVQEGHINKLPHPVRLNLLNPTVNIAAESRVFTTKEPPHFWINASGAAKATVKVYKKDLFSVMVPDAAAKYGVNISNDFSMYVDSSKKFQNPFGDLSPVKSFTRDLTMDVEDNAHAEFKFDSAMEPGDYFAVAEVVDPFGKNSARTVTWFSVGDVGLVVKYSPTKTIVRAVDLNTLKGQPGVNVKLMNHTEAGAFDVVATAATAGSDGLVTFPAQAKLAGAQGSNLVVTGEYGKSRAYGGFSIYQSDNDRHKTYFYTDRPVYRLGQTVYFKGISRVVDENGIKNLGEGKQLTVTVEDPDNNALNTFELKTNKHGTFHGLISIPEDAKTGGYQVQIAYPDGHTDYSAFEVAEYRKPEYQVEVTPLADRFIEGDKARAKVKASYYFGGPVANARVKYSVYSSTDYSTRWRLMDRPSYFDFFNSWSDGEEGEDYGGSGDFVAEGYAVTDANGEAIVEVPTTPAAMPQDSPVGQEFVDKKLKIEAEVTDISRLSVVSSGTANLVPGDFFLTVNPTNYVVKAGEAIGVDLQARDYNGKPVAAKDVTVKMVRYPYDRLKSEYKPAVTISEVSAKTDGNGKLHMDVAVGEQMPSDSYSIQATSKDTTGHNVADVSSVWVSNSGNPFSLSLRDAQAEPLTVKLNKKVYKPGDVARVMIAGPFNGKSGMDAMVAIEGRKLHDLKIVPLTSSAQLVEIPIKEEYCPNFYITVSMVGAKRQFYTQEQMVQVSPESHFLKLALATDKERYKPGETINYTITAKDSAGKPVKDVEVSLGVVDESIYAIRAETAPDITKFFYDRVPNWVSTFCTFPEQYSGGPDKMEPRVRKDFRDTAAWQPELTTDDKGEIHTQVKLPDNLTTWRATVRGINGGTEVGATINKTIATQEIIARLALPRFFSTGDEGFVTAVVHNYSGKPQKVKLALSISPLSGLAPSALKLGANPGTTLDIPADGAGRLSYPVTASGIGKVKIKLVATCPTGGDALEKELYVKPMGIPVTVVSSGCLTKDSDEATLQLTAPPDADASAMVKRVLSLSTSSIGPVLGNFSGLIDYPYGCTEQTMSRLVPSVVAMQLNKKLGVPLSKDDTKLFGSVYTEAMKKLSGYQHGDGGWGWWETDQSQPYLTALVMEGFKNLNDAGYVVQDNLVKGGLRWLDTNLGTLTDQLSDPKHMKDEYLDRERTTDLSYMLFAQSLWPHKVAITNTTKGKGTFVAPDEKATRYLLSKRDSLSPVGLAYLTRALHNKGRNSDAQACLNRLLTIANTTETTVDWELTKAMAKKLGVPEDGYYSYRFTNEEVSALAMQAIVEVSGKGTGDNANLSANQEIIEKIKAGLFLQRGKDGWNTTKTTAAVFKALLADELAVSQGTAGGAAGQTLEQIGVNFGGKLLRDLTLGNPRYAPETNVDVPLTGALNVKKSGAGRLYYTVTTDYYKNLAGAAASSTLANLPADLKIERSFYHLTSQASTTDGTIHVKAVPLQAGNIKAGETILMKVQVTTPRSLPYIMVQADLPSGAEVVQSDNQSAAVERDNEDRSNNAISGDWAAPWWTHQDILDDKIVFFGTDLRIGKNEFTTLLRMELPGKINVNPVMVEGMYTKSIKGFSTPLVDKLQVTE
ncbi:MAG: hypothetical protein JSS86_07540 [Cyanobacteria bacterium SZAS LIN-2]|nr:hypothetical protein [Cyanobacteria bacterium SZAS LIN-2]